jgi:hypothetical protein
MMNFSGKNIPQGCKSVIKRNDLKSILRKMNYDLSELGRVLNDVFQLEENDNVGNATLPSIREIDSLYRYVDNLQSYYREVL